MTRTTIGPYRIERELGSGGMGVVYAAFDERLRRPVAVKTLRTDSRDPAGRERLWREARAAAAVSHPNVCQIFDVGESGGEIFVAMELLEGETLAERLLRGPLGAADACATLLRVLAALDAIHRRGLVHRDLKPSNVFLTPHGVKLVDFGVALDTARLESGDATRVTLPGTLIGTPHYMAPEQVRAEPIDARADLFAAGVLLCEMLTGRPPFDGPTSADVLHAVLHGQPPALAHGPAAAIVARALAKRREDRFESAQVMAEAVAAASPGERRGASEPVLAPVASGPLTRLIVLPFRLLRPDPEIEFLEFSLADAITVSLGGLGSLVVRSTLSAPRAGTQPTLDLAALARAADVDLVLAGTLLRVGTKVRVASQLIEVPSGTVLWSDHAQVAMDDYFQFQDDLASRIVSSLELPLTAREHRLMHQDVPASPRAYERYLRAVQLGVRRSKWMEARDLLEACVAEDPSFAPGWARLGRIYRVLAKYSEEVDASAYDQAEAAFRRALEISPELPLANAGYASLELDLGRSREALARLLTLTRKHPTDASLFSALVLACRYGGLLDASLAAFHRAKLLDPRVQTSVLYTFMSLGLVRRALEETSDDRDPVRSQLLALCGRRDEAIAAARLSEAESHGVEAHFARALRLTLEGELAAARRTLIGVIGSNFRDPEGYHYLGVALVQTGDLELGFEQLRQSVSGGYANPNTLTSDDRLAEVRRLPGFAGLLEEARARHLDAVAAYEACGGPAVLGVPARPQPVSGSYAVSNSDSAN